MSAALLKGLPALAAGCVFLGVIGSRARTRSAGAALNQGVSRLTSHQRRAYAAEAQPTMTSLI